MPCNRALPGAMPIKGGKMDKGAGREKAGPMVPLDMTVWARLFVHGLVAQPCGMGELEPTISVMAKTRITPDEATAIDMTADESNAVKWNGTKADAMGAVRIDLCLDEIELIRKAVQKVADEGKLQPAPECLALCQALGIKATTK